jgi:hypothetical protein
MTCEQIQLLLYLDRSGERTREEDTLVTEHLRTCSTCRAEAAGITTTALRARDVLQREPSCSHQDALMKSVMLSVSARPDVMADFRHWLASHAEHMQYVLGSALAAICILFSYQSLHDARKLELLEQKTGRVRMPAHGPEDYSAGIRGLSGRVEANSFQTILSLLSHTTGERPQMLIDYWKKKYPVLATMHLTDNPTDEERRILATEGAALVEELTQWINAGGNHHER